MVFRKWLISISFIGFTSPLLSWYIAWCSWWRIRWFLVVPFPPCGLPLLFWAVCFAWTLVLAPLFLFSLPFLGAFFLWSLVGFHPVHCLDLDKVKWNLLLGVLLLGVFTFNTNFHPFFIKKYPPSFFFLFFFPMIPKKNHVGLLYVR